MEILNQLISSTWGIVLVLLFFNGTIYFHELGHFLAAKWRGLKVDRFSLFGIGPKLFGWQGKDGVEYCICWFPFGAYVALPQLADMRGIEGDIPASDNPLPPLSFTDKVVVAAAGPFFNLIFAILIACVIWVVGTPSSEQGQSRTVGHVFETIPGPNGDYVPGPAYLAGLQTGDEILAVDGVSVEDFQDIRMGIVTGIGSDDTQQRTVDFTIRRGDTTQTLTLNPILSLQNERSRERLRAIGYTPGYRPMIRALYEGTPAFQAGLQPGDVILEADGQTLHSSQQLIDITNDRTDTPLPLRIQRDSPDGLQEITLTVTPQAVPISKPILKITSPTAPGYVDVVPVYEAEGSADLASPSTPAKLVLMPVDAPEGVFQTLRDSDQLLAVNERDVDSLQSAQTALNAALASGEPVTLQLKRKSQLFQWVLPGDSQTLLQPANKVGQMGILLMSRDIETFPTPIEQFARSLEMTAKTIVSLFHPKSDIGPQHLMGAIDISRRIYMLSQLDLRIVLAFAVLLNINLAIINLLPIPVLDGGHITFAAAQKLRGKPLPASFVQGAQGTFMLLLFGLMFFILYNDSMRAFGEIEAEQNWERQQIYRMPPLYPKAVTDAED